MATKKKKKKKPRVAEYLHFNSGIEAVNPGKAPHDVSRTRKEAYEKRKANDGSVVVKLYSDGSRGRPMA